MTPTTRDQGTEALHHGEAQGGGATARSAGIPARSGVGVSLPLPSPGIWRFRSRFLADDRVSTAPAITMGEGDTPVVPLPRWGARHGLDRVYAKLDGANPTGSYKDRGMSILVSVARSLGASHLVEDSSGNAGAAAAAYAARAGMSCTVYAPAGAPAPKLRQIRAYGAELIAVPGPRSAVADAARNAGSVPGAYHVSHNDNPLFVVGNQSLGFELSETARALGFDGRPWHIVMPVGGGALFMGAATALLGSSTDQAGKWAGSGTVAIPRLHAAQTTHCAPIAEAFARGEPEPSTVIRRPTVCGGIEIERPQRGADILRAIAETGGSAVARDDADILRARDDLAMLEGIYAEPTSASALAALAHLAAAGTIGRDDLVFVIVTGSGLKDPGPA
ncbi:MAG: pyridoxal-phosphate dependent enzyme [Chloroflexi bacterium]|nr:pyridoxal-phosphate dependent enzyme [Chloroflexota bacterium]